MLSAGAMHFDDGFSVKPVFPITVSSPAIGFAACEETSSVAMSGLSGAGESQSHDSHGILEASETGEASFFFRPLFGEYYCINQKEKKNSRPMQLSIRYNHVADAAAAADVKTDAAVCQNRAKSRSKRPPRRGMLIE